MTHSNDIMMKPVGFIHSPYNDKFAVPRQPRLAPSAVCVLEFYPPYDTENAFEGIDGFSHLHLIFLFDRVCYEEFKPRVRPPRLGGNTYVGVFATRSPFRPNRIGMSIVKLERVIRQKGRVKLVLSGADLVDGTPVLDIKPYIPFVDSIPEAEGGFAKEPPVKLSVEFSQESKKSLSVLSDRCIKAIEESLSQDPRPAYKSDDNDSKMYCAKLYGFAVYFTVADLKVSVIKAERFEAVNENLL